MSDAVPRDPFATESVWVDQVVRKERFLKAHPEAVIEFDKAAPFRSQWRGRLPGHPEVVASELKEVLDGLEERVTRGLPVTLLIALLCISWYYSIH